MTSRFDFQLRRLRLRHLELLVRLAETGTLRSTAQRMNLTQPAISKMLVEIEAAFGMALFARSRRGMQANEFGIAATRHARVLLHELARAGQELDAIQAGATAVLRIGTPAVTATVPAALVDLQRQLPRLAVRLREGRAQELVRRLLDGELDAVVGTITTDVLQGGDARQLRSETIVGDHLCVLAGAGHPLARRRRLGWKELQGERWVTGPADTLVGQAYLAAFIDAGVVPPAPMIESASPAILGAVLRLDAGLLGAVRYEHARDELSRNQGLRLLPVTPVMALPPLSLLTRRAESSASDALAALAAALRSVSTAGHDRTG